MWTTKLDHHSTWVIHSYSVSIVGYIDRVEWDKITLSMRRLVRNIQTLWDMEKEKHHGTIFNRRNSSQNTCYKVTPMSSLAAPKLITQNLQIAETLIIKLWMKSLVRELYGRKTHCERNWKQSHNNLPASRELILKQYNWF